MNTMCIQGQKTIHNMGYKFMRKKRNSFEHDRRIHGLREVEDIRLNVAIKNI